MGYALKLITDRQYVWQLSIYFYHRQNCKLRMISMLSLGNLGIH